MPKKSKNEESPSPSMSCDDDSDMFDELELCEVLKIVDKHEKWADFIRDPVLFDSGLIEGAFAWLRELFNTKTPAAEEKNA